MCFWVTSYLSLLRSEIILNTGAISILLLRSKESRIAQDDFLCKAARRLIQHRSSVTAWVNLAYYLEAETVKSLFALLVLCLLSITPVVSQTKTDKDREQLVGPVKSVESFLIEFVRKNDGTVEEKSRRMFTTSYNTDGNIAERASYDQTDTITARYVHTYDTNGRSTGYEEYPYLIDKTLTIPRRHVYTLNEEGRKVEYIVFESNGKVGTRFVYKYDTRGNLIEEQWYGYTGTLGGRTVSTYDEVGNQTSQTNYQGESLNWKNISKYDSNGNRTESLQYHGKTLRYRFLSSYDSKGRILERETIEFNSIPGVLPPTHSPEPGKVVYTYDDEKRTKEIATYEVDGSLKDKFVYAYDERNNEVGLKVFNGDGSPKNGESHITNIEYDSYGNWTRKTRLTKSEKGEQPQRYHAERRVITYY